MPCFCLFLGTVFRVFPLSGISQFISHNRHGSFCLYHTTHSYIFISLVLYLYFFWHEKNLLHLLGYKLLNGGEMEPQYSKGHSGI